MSVRTRIAPSPTGDPHVGTAYVALMNYLFAKKAGGEFILRIEDTDAQRSTLASEKAILDSLTWIGLHWNEGPDVGGASGPYRQSERTEIYRRYADQLIADGHAFPCFCTPDRLELMRAEQRLAGKRAQYDGQCLRLSSSEARSMTLNGVPYVVRMKVPTEGVCVVEDLRRGPVEFAWETIDMQVLLKSDGMPTYHLANVVDDHLMNITHVLRGEEWLSSAPKHVLLYQYFRWEMPKLFHLPLLRNADRSKLSKRKNPTGILLYQRLGYLPEALFNFLGLFGVAVAEGEEMMDVDELTTRFSIEHISLGGPVFDVAKLDWLNGRYIREHLSDQEFADHVKAWALNPEFLGAIAPLVRKRLERLSDLGPLTSCFFSGRLNVPEAELRSGKLDDVTLRRAYQIAIWRFDRLATWEAASIEAVLRDTADLLMVKFRDLLRPFYVAITGKAVSVPLFDAIAILGRDLARERLREALTCVGGATAREVEEWKQLLALQEDASPEGEN